MDVSSRKRIKVIKNIRLLNKSLEMRCHEKC